MQNPKEVFQYGFEKLEVWQEGRDLAKTIYLITARFPDNEKFGLVNQMRRSAISVCSNIAEGSSRTSSKDQAHFYQLAYSSLMELLSQSIISCDLGFFASETLQPLRTKIENISRMLNALRKSRLQAAGSKQ